MAMALNSLAFARHNPSGRVSEKEQDETVDDNGDDDSVNDEDGYHSG